MVILFFLQVLRAKATQVIYKKLLKIEGLFLKFFVGSLFLLWLFFLLFLFFSSLSCLGLAVFLFFFV